MIKAFTDGSIRSDEVEVAAVLCRKGKPMHTLRTHKLHLGTASEHMVYEVELVDLLLGLQLIRTTGMNSVRGTPMKEEQRRCSKVVGSCLSNTNEQHIVKTSYLFGCFALHHFQLSSRGVSAIQGTIYVYSNT